MDFAARLHELQPCVARAKAAVQAAAAESHDRLKQRVDDREPELDQAVAAAEDGLAVEAQDRWAQAMADAIDRENAVKTKIRKRARAVDAAVAAKAADWADADAAAATRTPRLDGALRRVSRAAADWKPWIGTAAVLALTGGRRGRRAADYDLASTTVSSAVVNLVLKPIGGRRRPDHPRYQVPIFRRVAMRRSPSFPSGHAAAGAAFATGVGSTMPHAGIPLGAAAALVAYPRVPPGMHHPADVVGGSVAGTAQAQFVIAAVAGGRRRPRRASSLSPIEMPSGGSARAAPPRG
jgi:membrane-associated phospholipid phosphatase